MKTTRKWSYKNGKLRKWTSDKKVKDAPLVYRIIFGRGEVKQALGYDVFLNGAVKVYVEPYYNSEAMKQMIASGEVDESELDYLKKSDKQIVATLSKSIQEFVEEFKEERKDQHSLYVVLPDNPSNPKYTAAHETLWALREREQDSPLFSKDGKEISVEYFGEGEPWIPNPDYAERLRFLSKGGVY